MGSALVEFALAWHLTRETGSATVLATAMLVALLPQIVLGPVIGAFIDRWNRKTIMIFADLAVMTITVGLVVLFFTGAIQVWHIYVAMAGRAIGQAFQFPAMMAAVSNIVPEKDLARASGLTQTLQGIITIAAPPAGAFLMEALPMQRVLSVDIITAVIGVGCLLAITIPHPERTTLTAKGSVIPDMVQGFRYLWSSRGMMMLMGMVAMLGFFSTPAFTLLPVLVNEHLAGDVLKLGWLNSAFGVGMIAGGIILGAWGGFKRRIMTSFLGILIIGISLFGLGFTSVSLFMFALAVSLLLGVGISLGNAPFMAIIQSVVAKDMQGRVFSLVGSISSVMVPFGLAIAGPLADAIGIRWLYFISGVAFIVIILLSLFSKSLLNIENQKAEVKPAVDTLYQNLYN
jgi:DHA3 family macrolide efflux protein-like MFS transporter